MKRREFIQSSIALSALPAIGAAQAADTSSEKPVVRQYRQLGNTDIRMSDISFGAGKLPSASLALRAIDRGINYFDTAPDYGRSEEYLGEAVRKLKQRDRIYIASKMCEDGSYIRGRSHLQYGTSKADYKASVEASLKRLNTDYLDVVFVHAIGESRDVEQERKRLLDDNMLAAVDELKQEGKARYLAVSSHGPNGMEGLLLDAVRSGHYDIIMPAFNFMKFPKVPEVLKEAQARGVGVVAMKTLAGAKDMDLKPKDSPFDQAAFKWVLQHPEVAGLVVTIKRVRNLDEYLPASGAELTDADRRSLDRYAALYGRDYCRTGCGDCEAACPKGVQAASVLRYQMYFESYEDEKRAMEEYASLEQGAFPCLACADPRCVAACPHGLPVAAKLRAAHDSLSFLA